MAQAREQDRSAAAKGGRRGKRVKMRSATSGAFLRVRAEDDVTEVPVTKVRYGRIANKERVLSKVISGYADVAAKAKRNNKAYVISYVVTPDGKAQPLPEKAAEKDPGGGLEAAIARAKARGATKVAEILRSEDMLTAREFGPLIDASHETVNAKRKRHEVLALQGAKRGLRYPRWQVTGDGLELPGLPKLFEVFGDQPWAIYRFLRANHPELGGRTALEALKAGEVDAVLGVARNQATGAFS